MTERKAFYDLTDTAKLVRRCLKEAFPGVKFSVRSERFSMGSAIRVAWTDGPLAKVVSDLVGRFQYSGSMRIDDYVHSREHEVGGRPVSFGAKYVSCSRNVSDTVRKAIDQLSDQEMKAASQKLGLRDMPFDTYEDGSLRWRDEYAGRLAHNVPIWKGRQQPCAFAESIAITGEH